MGFGEKEAVAVWDSFLLFIWCVRQSPLGGGQAGETLSKTARMSIVKASMKSFHPDDNPPPSYGGAGRNPEVDFSRP